MSLVDLIASVRFALADRGRAALTLLGIMIGAGSIVLLASLLRGGEEALIATSQDATDSELIKVHRADPPISEREKTRRELSRADADLLAGAEALGGAAVASESARQTKAEIEGRQKRVSVISVTPGAVALYRLTVVKGRFVDGEDAEHRNRVCVVGDEVWKELLESRGDLADTRISIEGHLFSVVGVLARKAILGSTDSTDLWDRRVLVPETTYDAMFSPSHSADRIFVRRRTGPAVTMPMDALRGAVTALLERRHLGVHDFELDAEQGKSQQQLILSIVEALLFSTGLIALFVGGINIMNVMLVTVTERTREIGVRRAVGAPPRAILLQFLVEASVLTLVGGLLGVLAGAALAWLAALALGSLLGKWTFYVEAWSIGLALGLSIVTGLVFGLYPAWRAARLDPIEALRSE